MDCFDLWSYIKIDIGIRIIIIWIRDFHTHVSFIDVFVKNDGRIVVFICGYYHLLGLPW